MREFIAWFVCVVIIVLSFISDRQNHNDYRELQGATVKVAVENAKLKMQVEQYEEIISAIAEHPGKIEMKKDDGIFNKNHDKETMLRHNQRELILPFNHFEPAYFMYTKDILVNSDK